MDDIVAFVKLNQRERLSNLILSSEGKLQMVGAVGKVVNLLFVLSHAVIFPFFDSPKSYALGAHVERESVECDGELCLHDCQLLEYLYIRTRSTRHQEPARKEGKKAFHNLIRSQKVAPVNDRMDGLNERRLALTGL